jgi:hypothetical protein
LAGDLVPAYSDEARGSVSGSRSFETGLLFAVGKAGYVAQGCIFVASNRGCLPAAQLISAACL